MHKIVQSLINFLRDTVFAAPGFMDTFSRFTNRGLTLDVANLSLTFELSHTGKYGDYRRFVGQHFQGTIGRTMAVSAQ